MAYYFMLNKHRTVYHALLLILAVFYVGATLILTATTKADYQYSATYELGQYEYFTPPEELDAVTLNLKFFVDGYYNSGTESLNPFMFSTGISGTSTDVDVFTAEVHNGTSPYAIADTGDGSNTATCEGILQTNGSFTCDIPAGLLQGNYFIAVRHVHVSGTPYNNFTTDDSYGSALETWSNSVLINSTTPDLYDFTTTASQAQGDNQILVSDVLYGFYNGDVNQDGAINSTDFDLFYDDVVNGRFGYMSTDFNADTNVDGNDDPTLSHSLAANAEVQQAASDAPEYPTGFGSTPIWDQAYSNSTSLSTPVNNVGLSIPADIEVDYINHHLFVSDLDNNRILVFNLNDDGILEDNQADFVIGHDNFTDNSPNDGGTTEIDTLSSPTNLAFDPDTSYLYVTDEPNSRVLVFDVSNLNSNKPPAIFVLGQANFEDNNSHSGTYGFSHDIYGVAVDSNYIYVSDAGNNRVMIFAKNALANGMPASFELGHASGVNQYTASSPNDGLPVNNYGINNPFGLSVSSSDFLYIADGGNHRIMVFNTATLSNGMPATYVIGQSDFISGGSGGGDSNFTNPTDVKFDDSSGHIFVNDLISNRILIFNESELSPTGQHAIGVIGQQNFDDISAATSQQGLSYPRSSFFDSLNQVLYITDTGNNRVMIFSLSPNSGSSSFITQTGAPEVTTADGTLITKKGATLNGTVGALNDTSVSEYFEYWLASDTDLITTDQTKITKVPDPMTITDTIGDFSQTLTNLKEATVYDYHFCALNNYGISCGDTKTFSTAGTDLCANVDGVQSIVPSTLIFDNTGGINTCYCGFDRTTPADSEGMCRAPTNQNFSDSIKITLPADGSTISGTSTISVRIPSTGTDITSVKFYYDKISPDTYIGSDSSKTIVSLVPEMDRYSALWDTSKISNGHHQIVFEVVDASGAIFSDSIDISVNNQCTGALCSTTSARVPGDKNKTTGGTNLEYTSTNTGDTSNNMPKISSVKPIATTENNTLTSKTKSKVQQFLKTSQGNSISKTVTATGLAAAGATSAFAFSAASAVSFKEIALLPLRLWSLILIGFGFVKRSRPWGTVYNSITKQGLDPAYLELIGSNGKVVTTAITDINGRYGFLVAPGYYMLRVKKENFIFPSMLLGQVTRDEVYSDLYFGNYFEVKKQGEVITRNIPMDPEKFDWNEAKKIEDKLSTTFSKKMIFLSRLSDILFFLGIAVSLTVFVLAPRPYNIVVFGLYIFLLILKEVGVSISKLGSVVDGPTGKPLSYAVVRAYSAALGNEVAHKVTNVRGQFYMLVPNGTYILTIENKNTDASYSRVFTSKSFEVKKGIVKGIWEIPR